MTGKGRGYWDRTKCEKCKDPFKYWRTFGEHRFCSRACQLAAARDKQNRRKLPDVDVVIGLYVRRRWSLKRIALRYQCNPSNVYAALKKEGIVPLRKRRKLEVEVSVDDSLCDAPDLIA